MTEQAQAWQRQVGALLELDGPSPTHDPPAALTAQLRPYQRDGFGWLAFLWELELGGILADDMGLGKTLQTLALICHARGRAAGVGPFLVVAPTSVVSNWAAEAARFAPGLTVAAVTDTLAKSGRTIDEVAGRRRRGHDIHAVAARGRRLPRPWTGPAWSSTRRSTSRTTRRKTYRCVRELAAPFKLAITGTPMENNLMELWSLLSITAPGLFPDPQAVRRAVRRGRSSATATPSGSARLRRRIKPLVKRRTKELVAADLPPKQEQILEVELHPRHRKLYDTHLQRERQKILGLIDDFDRNRFTILRSITLLRQLSLHPALVDDEPRRRPVRQARRARRAARRRDRRRPPGAGLQPVHRLPRQVRDRLDHEGIELLLPRRPHAPARPGRSSASRTATDPVFLISLKAGGFGLNLTEADYCFLLDPWWNPATEAQAIDRTHRIGQTRPVIVYRLIARDTIEEKVVALARRKAAAVQRRHGRRRPVRRAASPRDDIRGLLG